jgi:hypothetical protein
MPGIGKVPHLSAGMENALGMVRVPHMRHTILSAIEHGKLAALICAIHRHIASLVSRNQEVLCSVEVDRIDCSVIVLHVLSI